jgi:hypothetical protein
MQSLKKSKPKNHLSPFSRRSPASLAFDLLEFGIYRLVFKTGQSLLLEFEFLEFGISYQFI